MLQTDIDSLPLQELIDLLVKNTLELRELTEKWGVDRIIVVSKRSDIKIIQSAIQNKMRADSNPLLYSVVGTHGQHN